MAGWMSAGPAVQLASIARKFGSEFVLRDVNLELAAGECLVLFGNNGAGKTTLLRLLAGLLSPSRGEGRVFGFDLADRRSLREQVFLMGEGGLYADLTVQENLTFWAKLYQVPLKAELLERVGLGQAVHKRVRALSSGMRKRLQLARLRLVPSPLLLLDEPLANLDEAGRALMLSEVQAAHASGRTVIFSAHEPDLARRIATQERHLRGGLLMETP